jgi:hypothetical protein
VARSRGAGVIDRGIEADDRVTGVVTRRFGGIACLGLPRNRDARADDRGGQRVARHGQQGRRDGLLTTVTIARPGDSVSRPGSSRWIERVVVKRSTAARESADETVSFDRFPVTFDERGVWLQASSRTLERLEVVAPHAQFVVRRDEEPPLFWCCCACSLGWTRMFPCA